MEPSDADRDPPADPAETAPLRLDGGELRADGDTPPPGQADTAPHAPAVPPPTLLLHDPTAAQRAIDRENPFVRRPPEPVADVDPHAEARRYRILKPHAKGGLGQVFVAVDAELNREVALKEIKEQFADDAEARRRFLFEGEVTGALEHPGIVPVYGLGAYDDGRPFYAMRFIRGDDLQTELRRFHDSVAKRRDVYAGATELRKLLSRFVDVCQAVAYAHDRGVLHRDIKPSNIMLGKYGETLVVDWGLARLMNAPREQAPARSPTPILEPDDDFGETSGVASDEAPVRPKASRGARSTIVGTLLGSPNYMSPELATGMHDIAGVPSDVFLLGATLFEILTGQPPYVGRSTLDVLKLARECRHPRPRDVWPGAPKPLEAICLKAMSRQPEDRYPSATALADDVERWLNDEPVSAARESAWDRGRRWLRKHRAWATSGTAALAVVAAVATTAAVVIQSQKDDIARLAEQEREAKDEALRNADIARRQRDLALDTLSSLVFDVQDRMEARPALHTLKEDLLGVAVDGLAKVSQAIEGGAERTGRMAAMARIRLADIYTVVGRTSEAERLVLAALVELEKLLAAEPSDRSLARDLSIAHQRLGDARLAAGDLTAARRSFEMVLEIVEPPANAADADARAKRDLSLALERLGNTSQTAGDLPAARKYFERALAIDEALAREEPENDERKRDLSIDHERLGTVMQAAGEFALARQAFEACQTIRRQLVEADGASVVARRDLAIACERLGDALQASGDLLGAKAQFEEALALAEALVKADPENTQPRRGLAVAHERLAEITSLLGDQAAARQGFETALAIHRRLAEDDPDHAPTRRGLSVACNNLADALLAAGDTAGARRLYEEGLALSQALADADLANAEAARDLAVSHGKLGDACRAEDDLAAARDHHEKSLAIRQRLANLDPTNADLQRDLGIGHERLGDICQATGDMPAAGDHFARRLEIAIHLAREASSPVAERDLSIAYERLGEFNRANKNLAAARGFFERSRAIRQQLANANTASAQAARDLAVNELNLALVDKEDGDAPAAATLAHQALATLTRLAATDTSNAAAQSDLWTCFAELLAIGQANAGATIDRAVVDAAITARRGFVTADTTRAAAADDLVLTCLKVGMLFEARQDASAARAYFTLAKDILTQLAADTPESAWRAGLAAEADTGLARLNQPKSDDAPK